MMRFSPLLFLLALPAALAQVAAPAGVPPPPPMTAPGQPPEEQPPPEQQPPAESAEVIEPQVTILRRGEDVIEEYRVGGQLYMLKITPAKGFPYFLVDTDGDGSMETRRNELSNPSIPQWVIFRW